MTSDPRAVLSRPAPPPDFTVAYGDHAEQIADVRLPPGDRPWRPLVVFVHGGFWSAEYDRVHAAPLATDLASRGYPVVSLEYRRIGQDGGGWPGTFDDVAAGIEALPELLAVAMTERGDEPLEDGAPILMGHSAGGALVLWAGRRAGGDVRGVLALAPVADLARGYALRLGDGATGELLGGGPDEFPARYAQVDPAANLPIGAHTVVVHGRLDRQVPYQVGRDWVAASRAAGDGTRFVDLAETEHFGLIDPLSTAWPSVLAALESLEAVAVDDRVERG